MAMDTRRTNVALEEVAAKLDPDFGSIEGSPRLGAIFRTLVPSGAPEAIWQDLRSVSPLPQSPPNRVERGHVSSRHATCGRAWSEVAVRQG